MSSSTLSHVETNSALPAAPEASHGENSEVLPAASVAVAVTTRPSPSAAGTSRSNEALPAASVLTVVVAKGVAPSPPPDGSQARLV
jgi:hypothetical protein